MLLVLASLLLLGMEADVALRALLLGSVAVGVLATGLAVRRPSEGLRRWIGFIALEEITAIAWSTGAEAGQYWGPARLWLLVLCTVGAAWLLFALPLPDRWLPLSGAWLRRFVGVTLLAGLVIAGPWRFLADYWWTVGHARWMLAPAGAVGLVALASALQLLVRGWGIPLPRLTRSRRPATG